MKNILRHNKGQTIIFGYLGLILLLGITVIIIIRGISEKNLRERAQAAAEVFYLAEGATESGIASFISRIADFDLASDIETYNTTTTYSTFNNTVVSTSISRIDDSERIVAEGSTNVLVRNYLVTSTATHPFYPGISITLNQIIARRLIPTFQHAVFYNDDLEILPGPNMYLSGRIHSNGDMYLDAEGSSTLTIDSTYVRSAGSVYNQRKDNGSERSGEVMLLVEGSSPAEYQPMNNLDSDVPTWTTDAITRWQGSIQSATHGVTRLASPSVGSIQPTGYYASNADIKVENGNIYRGSTLLVEGVDYPAGTLITSTNMYNNREGRYVRSSDIDIRKLAGYAPSDPEGSPSFPNNLPANGLLYATRNDVVGTYQAGIRLLNGSKIYQDIGLTVVSNDPVYIQGDYNTVDERPASVICDSVNLLSNSWNDANSVNPLNSRVASSTTYNLAFIAGVKPTESSVYSGGLENYPRMHEKWSGKTLTIKGSFVELWESSVAQGNWQYGDPQYTAPIRNWSYNSGFNDPSNLPPFTPWTVEAKRVAWWKE